MAAFVEHDFPSGLKFLLDQIRQAGMVPGLWLEPEVAGAKSLLAQKPDHWFFMRHGKRVLKNSRFLLDFRNPEVRSLPRSGDRKTRQ